MCRGNKGKKKAGDFITNQLLYQLSYTGLGVCGG